MQGQDAVLKLSADVLGLQLLADIEAACAAAGSTLLADIAALVVLVIQLLIALGADGQIAVVQIQLDILFLEAGQINEHIVAVLVLADIGFHHIGGTFAKHTAGGSGLHGAVKIVLPIVAEQIIHQSLIEHIRNHHHKSFLQFSSAERRLCVQLTFELSFVVPLGFWFFRPCSSWNAFIITQRISTVNSRVLMFTSCVIIVHKICNKF